MIIIAGDSWGAGVWKDGKLIHRGLAQFCSEAGYSVINLSIPGGSNQQAVFRLEDFFNINQNLQNSISCVLYFVTEWTRDNITSEEISDCQGFEELESRQSSKVYFALERARQLHNFSCDIYAIGGVSDVNQYAADINNIKVLSNSVVNELTDQNCHTVYTWWSHQSKHTMNLIKKHRPDMTEHLLQSIELGQHREHQCLNAPEWFYPDGAHANVNAHKKLYYKLLQINNLTHQTVASASSHSKNSAPSNLLKTEARDGY